MTDVMKARADRIASQVRSGMFDKYLAIIVDAGNERFKAVYRPGESGAEGSASARTLTDGRSLMIEAGRYVAAKNLIQPDTESKLLGVDRHNAAAILAGKYDELAAVRKPPAARVPTKAEIRARQAAALKSGDGRRTKIKKGVRK